MRSHNKYIFVSAVAIILSSPPLFCFAEDTQTAAEPRILKTELVPPTKPLPPKTGKSDTHLDGLLPGNTQGQATGTRASTTRPLPQKIKDEIENRDKMMDASSTGPVTPEMRARIDAAREKLGKEREGQTKEFVKKTLLRLRAATDRLSKLGDRIDSRILKQKQAGGDTSKAEAALGEARVKIARAKEAIVEAEKLFADYVPPAQENTHASGTPATKQQPGMGQPNPLRDTLKKADQALRDAQKALVDAVTALRPIGGAARTGNSTDEKHPLQPSGEDATHGNSATQTPTLPLQ